MRIISLLMVCEQWVKLSVNVQGHCAKNFGSFASRGVVSRDHGLCLTVRKLSHKKKLVLTLFPKHTCADRSQNFLLKDREK